MVNGKSSGSGKVDRSSVSLDTRNILPDDVVTCQQSSLGDLFIIDRNCSGHVEVKGIFFATLPGSTGTHGTELIDFILEWNSGDGVSNKHLLH